MEEEDSPSTPLTTPVDEKVRLTPIEYAAITDHINRKAVAPNDECPVCGSRNNSVLADIYRLDVLVQGLVVRGEHQPIIATACNNCGFIRMFNRLVVDRLIAAEIGALEQPPAAPDDGS